MPADGRVVIGQPSELFCGLKEKVFSRELLGFQPLFMMQQPIVYEKHEPRAFGGQPQCSKRTERAETVADRKIYLLGGFALMTSGTEVPPWCPTSRMYKAVKELSIAL